MDAQEPQPDQDADQAAGTQTTSAPPRGHAAAGGHAATSWRAMLESATLREILMGAQDNLTNVLAVVLGVAIGAGRADLVALAGLAAAIAEAVSMGGVLYTATRADRASGAASADGIPPVLDPRRLTPALSGLVTFLAAMAAGMVPLVPFALLPIDLAAGVSVTVSLAALFALGALTGRVTGNIWWRDGLRMIAVAGLAALAAAVVGALLPIA